MRKILGLAFRVELIGTHGKNSKKMSKKNTRTAMITEWMLRI